MPMPEGREGKEGAGAGASAGAGAGAGEEEGGGYNHVAGENYK